MRLKVELNSSVGKILDAKIKRLKNPKPALEEIGRYQLAEIDRRFEKETDPDGVPWKPNSPGILAYKKRRGFILKVLQQTGRMKKSFKYRIDGDRLTITNSVRYAGDHQYGVGVPVRRMIGFPPENIREMEAILDRYYADGG